MNDINQLQDSLAQTRADLKRALEKDLANIQEDLGQVAKVVGIAAGVGLASFFLLRKVFKRKKKTQSTSLPEAVSRESIIVRLIKEQVAIFVAAILRQKLQELLVKLKVLENDADS